MRNINAMLPLQKQGAKEKCNFIKSKRQKLDLCVAKWVRSAFLQADYEKLTHLMLSKDPAVVKGWKK